MSLPGFEIWGPGVGITGMLTFLFVGLAKGWLWTKYQVDRINSQHDEALKRLGKEHDEHIQEIISRYETHLTRTVELYQGRVYDARTREDQWQLVATTALETNREFADQMDAVVESQRTIVQIISAARDSYGRRRAG